MGVGVDEEEPQPECVRKGSVGKAREQYNEKELEIQRGETANPSSSPSRAAPPTAVLSRTSWLPQDRP